MRKRTLETFPIPGARETGLHVDGVESAEDEQKTPKVGNATEAEESGTAGRYSTSKHVQFITGMRSLLRKCLPQMKFQGGNICISVWPAAPFLYISARFLLIPVQYLSNSTQGS